MGNLAIDHVQIAMPVGGEEAARGFYGGLLGLTEIPKPANMASRGGCWFQLATQQLHMGTETDFRPAKKAHVALATKDLDAVRARLQAHGYTISVDAAIDGRRRFFSEDPFGNRIEFLAQRSRETVASGAAVTIRAAIDADRDAIDALHRAAFATTEFGYQGEAELVRALDADSDILVSLVAEKAGSVAGHMVFSRMTVEADGQQLSGAGLAPVAVEPALHGQGIGEALIRAGIAALREQGCAISFVLGHEGYYPRFGYSPELAARFASPFAGPHFMAMMLDSDAAWPLGGRADYAPAFGRMG